MPDDTDITELDARTVERIAAGEVVERPASVVKELVENAIDADADRVEVAVEAGGTERITVSDDGLGMTEAGVRQAVREHTTSKIADIEDLEGGVATLGFRGEALHAIGAVSRTTVTTCPRGPATGDAADNSTAGAAAGNSTADDPTATELTVEGGEVTSVGPAGRPPGTTVEVTDLFYNVPARRKYLKTEGTEFGHVNRVVASYALANPGVAVVLEHDGREVFATTGDGDLRAAVMAVYGREVASSMVPVDPGELPEGPLDGVSGLVSHPETTRSSREYLSTFVNGRYVTATAVRDAVVDAYDTQLGPDRYPFAVLDLALDPGTVDVNVHPRKLEVRFADEAAVKEQVEAAVHAALMREGLVRTRAPRGRSAPEEAAVEPEEAGVEPESDGEAGVFSSGNEPTGEAGDGSSGHERTVASDDGPAGRGDGPTETAGAGRRAGGMSADDEPSRPDTGTDASGGRAPDVAVGDDAADDAPSTDPHPQRQAAVDAPETGSHEGSDPARKFGGAAEQAGLGDAEGPGASAHDFDALPAMRLLGQFRETYLVGETADGLVLVDQHAADERVNYERLLDAFEGEITTQVLAQPVSVSVTAGEAALAETHSDALARLGFRLGPVEDGTVEVRTVPDLVGETADPDLLRDVLGDLVADAGDAAGTVEAAAEGLLADLACYPSVTGNTSLAEGSALALLEQLDACENPWACPHGRPTVIVLEDDEIEGRFERDYPGH